MKCDVFYAMAFFSMWFFITVVFLYVALCSKIVNTKLANNIAPEFWMTSNDH